MLQAHICIDTPSRISLSVTADWILEVFFRFLTAAWVSSMKVLWLSSFPSSGYRNIRPTNLMRFWPCIVLICGNKMPTRCNRVFFADLIACSTCFGHHYAHHQELKSIIQWLLRVVFCAVVFSSSWSGVELKVMRPVCRMLQQPETFWASNKICNKNICCI